VTAGRAAGNEIYAPMVVVIVGGLLSSTFRNMLVVPVPYQRGAARPVEPRWRSISRKPVWERRPRLEDLPAERDEFVDKIWSRSFQRRGDFGQVQSYGPVIVAEIRRDMRIAPFGLATRRTNALAPSVSTDEASGIGCGGRI